MPIRTRQEYYSSCMSVSQGRCVNWATGYNTVPITDWNINPQNPNFSWTQGSGFPSNFSQQITVAELQYIYPEYESFKFTIQFTNSFPSVDWLAKSCAAITGSIGETAEHVLNLLPGESTTVNYAFQNLQNLSSGNQSIFIKLRAYGISGGVETLLSQEDNMAFTSGNISLSVQNTVSGINTDKNTLNLVFNKAGSLLSGDTSLLAYSSGVSATLNFTSLSAVASPSGSNTQILIQKNTETDNLAVGTFNGNILTLTSGSVTKDITVNLEVINDATQFSPDQTYLSYTLIKSDNLKANGNVNISNPNALTITVDSYPTFLEAATVTGNTLSFNSKSAEALGVGLFSGNIVLKSGSVTKTVSVVVKVVDQITHDFSGAPYYFALDKKKVEITKTNANAVKVYMQLDMFFQGYGEIHQETQVYQLSYFQDKAVFYPGDEVNDFFVKKRTMQSFSASFEPYSLANVKMTFSEIDASDNVLNSYIIDNVKFAPGYTPYCFPFYTDFAVRRYYPDSKLAISADIIAAKPELTNLLTLINQTQGSGMKVKTFTFDKSVISATGIVDLQKVQLVPLPAPEETAHIFWETHNLVFDWFSCTGNHSTPSDFDHTVDENAQNGQGEKFDTKQTDTFNINTGWVLPEEREMIDEIIKSNFCIIQYPDKTIKARPTGKKSTLKSSEKGFVEMVLEFKILKDER